MFEKRQAVSIPDSACIGVPYDQVYRAVGFRRGIRSQCRILLVEPQSHQMITVDQPAFSETAREVLSKVLI